MSRTTAGAAPSAGTGDSPAGDVSRRVVRGAVWVMTLRVVGRMATLVRTLVLVRLLTPHDFGLVGVALAVVAFAEALSGTGVHLALLGRQREDRAAYDTAWTIGIARGAALSTILVALAPALAAFFDVPEATNLIRLMSLAPLIDAFNNIGVIEFRRDLTFGPHYVLQAAGEFADLLVAVPLALWTGSAWALAWAWIAMWCVRVAVSYVIHPYRPRLRFDVGQSRVLLRYAWHVTGIGGVGWLLGGGVDAFVGRVLGIEALGLYRMAKLVALILPSEIAGVLSWVAVGAFARLGGSAARVGTAFVDVLRVTLLAAVPICVGTAVFAPEIVQVVFGPPWTALVPVMRVMAVLGVVRAAMAVTGAAFQGQGQPKFQTYASMVELTVLIALFLPLVSRLGLVGAATAVTLAALVALAVALTIARRVVHVRYADLAACLAWPLLAASSLVAIGAAAGDATASVPRLVVVVAASGAAYLAALLVLEQARVMPPALLTVLPGWIVRRARRDA